MRPLCKNIYAIRMLVCALPVLCLEAQAQNMSEESPLSHLDCLSTRPYGTLPSHCKTAHKETIPSSYKKAGQFSGSPAPQLPTARQCSCSRFKGFRIGYRGQPH